MVERRPDGPGWRELPYPPEAALLQEAVLHASAWVNGAGVLVLSDLAVMELPKSGASPDGEDAVAFAMVSLGLAVLSGVSLLCLLGGIGVDE